MRFVRYPWRIHRRRPAAEPSMIVAGSLVRSPNPRDRFFHRSRARPARPAGPAAAKPLSKSGEKRAPGDTREKANSRSKAKEERSKDSLRSSPSAANAAKRSAYRPSMSMGRRRDHLLDRRRDAEDPRPPRLVESHRPQGAIAPPVDALQKPFCHRHPTRFHHPLGSVLRGMLRSPADERSVGKKAQGIV